MKQSSSWSLELTPDTWWFDDTIMPLNDYRYQYMCDEHQTPTGILAWQNDTIAFAEYRHYEYYRLYVMKAPRHWVKTLEQLADAATMTANHFVSRLRAIDGARTRGLDLGKVARYQLRHYRMP